MAVLSDQPPREPHLYRACTRAPQPSISISSWTPIPGVCSGHHGSQDCGSGALSQTAGGFHGPCMSLRITGVWGTVRALRSATPSKPPESSVGPAGGLRLSAGRWGGGSEGCAIMVPRWPPQGMLLTNNPTLTSALQRPPAHAAGSRGPRNRAFHEPA